MGLRTYSADAFMVLDPQTRRNLDLFEAGRLGERHGSLLAVLDDTKTPMGARLMRRWIAEPLLDRGYVVRKGRWLKLAEGLQPSATHNYRRIIEASQDGSYVYRQSRCLQLVKCLERCSTHISV